MVFDPRFDAIESMGALREHEGQPHDRHPSETHTRPIAVGGEMFVQSCGHAHVLALRDEDRSIIYSLVVGSDFCAHLTSLIHFSFSRENEDSPQQATGYQKENRLLMRNHGFSNSSL